MVFGTYGERKMLKKLAIITAVVGALGGLYGCTEGDDTSIIVEGDNNGGGGNPDPGGGTISENCPDWTSARDRDADGNDVCQLPANITENRTLSSDIVWFMEGTVTVGNGNNEMSDIEGELANGATVLDVTLTVQPGTHIKGDTGSFANMIITRGSQIMAEGTADAPIVFSSFDDDFTGAGEWGGLILHGYGLHNECSDPAMACNVDSEGESGFAGGFTEDDSSGVLRYVVVTEGGFEFAPGNEINGISLVGVGSGTEMEFIQINDNADDGIEFYGGNVNVKHLVLTGNLDDSVDWDEGFQGNLQYVLVLQDSDDIFGTAIEADTFGTDAFLSKPTIANATFFASAGASSPQGMHNMKSGTGGFIHNSIIVADMANTDYTACIFVNGSDAQALQNTALVYNNVIVDCGEIGATDFAEDGTPDTTGFSLTGPFFEVAADLNASYASQAAEAELGAPIDWTAINGTFGESTADPDYLDATDYLGAVDPNASELWFEGWTLDGTL